MRPVGRLVAPLAAMALVPGVASAHGVTTDAFETPIPLDLLLVGAAATVGVTALWLFAHGRVPTALDRKPLGSVAPPVARAARIVARVGFLGLFVGAVVAGLFGRQIGAENPATLFVWPVWLKGVGLAAIVAGSPWRVLSPWRTIYDALVRLEGREIALMGAYPDRLGAWPAFLGFVVVVGIVENLTVVPTSPRKTVILLAIGALLMVAGACCFGPAWFRHADPLAVLYRLLGRVAPLDVARRSDGGYDVAVRAPWTGCTAPVAGPAVAAFVVAMVYTVSFDGYAETRGYQTLLFDARDLLGTDAGTSTLLYLVGLAAFLATYLGAAALVAALGGAREAERSWLDTAVGVAPTLLPIAAAYEVAHTYPYVLRNLDRFVVSLFDVVGVHAHPVEPLSWLTLAGFWGSQVALIVAGHVVAVVAAHAVALDRFDGTSAARRGHLPLVAVMVGYTVLSLWIVSRPVVA